jgi:6-pyruvoyltetrahydropterin/6-carboxytetrahydropterin synthase
VKQSQITANRYHDISVGHRVVGHEGKCRFLHGHNYRIHFEVAADDSADPLDDVGRVLDFGVIKSHLCMFLENEWDHKFLAWEDDPLVNRMFAAIAYTEDDRESDYFRNSVVFVPFNPTAENMAQYLVEVVAPLRLMGTGCTLIKVVVEETRKCSCTYTKGD